MRVYIRLRVINLMFSSAYTKDSYVFIYSLVWSMKHGEFKVQTLQVYIFWFCNSFVGAWYVTHWIVDIPFHQAWERFSIYILTRLLFPSSPEKSLLLQEDGIQKWSIKAWVGLFIFEDHGPFQPNFNFQFLIKVNVLTKLQPNASNSNSHEGKWYS